MAEVGCSVFNEVLTILKDTRCVTEVDVLKEAVQVSIQLLEGLYRPLLDGYYGGEYCKETYCGIRDFRDTGLTYLHYAYQTLDEIRYEICKDEEVKNSKDYIKEAVSWIEKARTLLCPEYSSMECSSLYTTCESLSCSVVCDKSYVSSCDDEDTCESGCDYSESDSDCCDY